ncbi:ArsA family ATPase [Aquihabitans sp. G128]|uniref:ArsA family ATPase n=1 Tax=Aquihabitans sp. G128 TaxID=2849779 RepID=UPI001C248E83|nr:ArsA family ATPase [Aquihabitans sp. G128]QXC60062.1 ArsA family ATPase [Aquihabitans sp. G128]
MSPAADGPAARKRPKQASAKKAAPRKAAAKRTGAAKSADAAKGADARMAATSAERAAARANAPAVHAGLTDLVTQRHIVICSGSGGVGKTTTAAVLAMEAAQAGRRAVVVTIDPAKRLADALGLDGIGNVPSRIDGPWPGELWAVMLDTKGTFDDLVTRYSTEAGQADRILENRFYRNISGALSGTQEYMAMEKLYDLHADEGFDLVVVDTPPSRNALDFLEAPRRLTQFLDHRLYRVLMAPTRGVMKAVNVAAQAFVRSVSKVVGGEVFDDAIAFFQAFDGMEQGFKERAKLVLALLTSPSTAFVLVASPNRDTVAEARFFADKLAEADIPVAALVVNRMHPHFTDDLPEALRARAETLKGTDLGGLYRNLADFALVAGREEEHLAGLAEQVEPAPVVRVPFLRSDVHDLTGLGLVADHLFGRA